MSDAVSRPATPIQPQDEPDKEYLRPHDASVGDALSRPDTINPAADQDVMEVHAQLHEITPSSTQPNCRICAAKFGCIQELGRHIQSHHLPRYIFCPFQGCNWTGRCQSDFKEHWRGKHPEADQAPGDEIYDPKDFVKSIIDGTPVDEVVRSAAAKVQEYLKQHGVSMGDSLSPPDTPNPAPDQDEMEVNAQPHEIRPSTQLNCRICAAKFGRVQERNRHIESHLPHSILCLYQACNWTGRRQWDFKEHWRRKHSEAGQVPKEHENEIYEPKDYVTSIVDGAPVDEVARSAFARVQEGLRRLGKPDVGAKVLGRSRDLREWIPIS